MAFEITNKTTIIIISSIFLIYSFHFLQDFTIQERWPDFAYVKHAILNPPIQNHMNILMHFLRPPTAIETFFVNTFNSWKLFPVITSGLLLLQVFFFAKKLAKKRLSGILAVIIVFQSSTFLIYDSSFSYNFFWILLFIFSIHIINTNWYLSIPSFLFSVLSKFLSAVYFPITIFYILLDDSSRKKKMKILFTYAGIFGALFFISTSFGFTIHELDLVFDSSNNEFSLERFFLGYASFSNQLRYDSFIVIFLIPLVIGLFYKAREGMQEANIVLLMITVSILASGPLLYSLGGFTIQPYRHIAFIIFTALGYALLFSNHHLIGKKKDHTV